MSLVLTDAIVLQSFPYGETSRIVRLLTRAAGVQSAIAKGAVRPRSRFASMEPFAEGTASLHIRPSATCRRWRLRPDAAAAAGLGRDLLRFGGASLIAELVMRTASEEAQEGLYDAVSAGARPAGARRSLPPSSARSSPAPGTSSRVLGFMPELDGCIVCGDDRPALDATFDYAAGGLRCDGCAAGLPGRRIPPRARAALAAFCAARRCAVAVTEGHWRLLTRYLEHHILEGAPLRSLQFLALSLSAADAPLVLGTAGHIDHGKTALVRALTGVDTDRLPEEKRPRHHHRSRLREPRPAGRHALGIVDVPGHEAFVRNMLAGRDGHRPDAAGRRGRRGRHAADARAPGHHRAARHPARRRRLTKADLVDASGSSWCATTCATLAPTPLARDVPMVDRLGAHRAPASTSCATRWPRRGRVHAASCAADDLFRMPVDRVFTVRGTGTVVTGTVWSGTLRRDAQVRIEPGGHHGPGARAAAPRRRVRRDPRGRARRRGAGRHRPPHARRGDWLVLGAAGTPSRMLTVELDRAARRAAPVTAAAARPRPPRHRGSPGRVALPDGEVEPGGVASPSCASRAGRGAPATGS
jgi:DNA repair protein RecO (recombination protein O)